VIGCGASWMRSTWNPSPDELDRFACEHIEFEIRMLLQQFGLLERRHDLERRYDEDVADTRRNLGADGQALLEAVLVHLRLLDDFLGHPKQAEKQGADAGDDVFARHWDENWEPRRFLSKEERDRVNAQLVHLTARRLTHRGDIQPDELPGLVKECCLGLREFLRRVGVIDRRRLEAFGGAPERVAQYLDNKAACKWAA